MRGLTKVYGVGLAEVRALAGVDLDLFEGELVVLLGPSGSGKTTLLNNLGGLDVPTAGELSYRELDLTAANEDQLTRYRRETVGFIFQFYNLIPSLTARENVGLITEIASDPMPPETALEMVNLGARMDHFPAQLSGGEQQRVAIARAIAKRPEVLLCDEPTGALDVRTGIVVLEAIQRVNQDLGTLTVIITHNAAMADMADRVIHLSDGQVQQIHTNDHPVAGKFVEMVMKYQLSPTLHCSNQPSRSVWSAWSLLTLSDVRCGTTAPASWTHSKHFATFGRFLDLHAYLYSSDFGFRISFGLLISAFGLFPVCSPTWIANSGAICAE